MRERKSRVRSRRRIFAVPIALGAASLFGLLAALIGNGVWDVLSWLTLGLPVAAVIWARSRS